MIKETIEKTKKGGTELNKRNIMEKIKKEMSILRKISLSLVVVLAGLCLFMQNVEAYMISDNVYVRESYYPDVWVDKIGGSVFEIYGINYIHYIQTGNNFTFDIFTNYPASGYQVSNWYTKPGDFMLDINGDEVYDYALALVDHSDTSEYDGNISAGQLFQISDLYHSSYYAPSSNFIYGTHWRYETTPPGASHLAYVRANGDSIGSPVDVVWFSDSDESDYRINFTIDLTDILPSDFSGRPGIYWAASTCANDVIVGKRVIGQQQPIPEPGSWLMLGGGVIGLVAFGSRKKS